MLQGADRLGLLLKPPDDLFRAQPAGVDELQGEKPGDPQVAGLVNDAAATLADFLDDLITAAGTPLPRLGLALACTEDASDVYFTSTIVHGKRRQSCLRCQR